MRITVDTSKVPKIVNPLEEIEYVRLADGTEYRLGLVWFEDNSWVTKVYIRKDKNQFFNTTYSSSDGTKLGVDMREVAKFGKLGKKTHFICWGVDIVKMCAGLERLHDEGIIKNLKEQLRLIVKGVE